MLLGVTTERNVGLALVAGAFIVFALLSSFYFPRRNPSFPGNRLGLFVLVTVVLFLATLSGVVFLAKEPEEAGGAEAAATQGTETGGGGQATTTGGGSEAAGDPAAGKAVFASAGCGGCHTLAAAGTSGTVGPNLDQSKPARDLVVNRVTNGKPPMPSFKGQLDEQQIQDVAAYVVASTQG